MVITTPPKQRLTLAEYQAHASAANQFRDKAEALDQLRFGLFGEVGGVLAAVKKANRDQLADAEKNQVIEELGDALWYLTMVAEGYKLSFSHVGASALKDLQTRLGVQHALPAGGAHSFAQFDGLTNLCCVQIQSLSQVETLARLGADTGRLIGSGIPDLAGHPPDNLLATILADIVTVAALFNLSVEAIAEANIKKFESRWPPQGAMYLPLFDENRPTHEQLPRKLSMHFIEREDANGKPYVVQQLEGVNIGDRLTDNKTQPDGYRFHDVFHLAYLAHLGWSPVIRALLKLKRKGDAALDENQDGARAIIIEEGIATWIFNQADQHAYFRDTQLGRLGYGLLKQASDMVKGYEVEACPLWQWERAILDGFSVFRQMFAAGKGIVDVDLLGHTIQFRALEAEHRPPQQPKPRTVIAGAVLPPSDS
jgi:NTP pyrophosphatase (non-canonical NTP hydrolase)